VDIMKALDIDNDITVSYESNGHVAHMSSERLPHIALYRCTDGSRPRPKKKWLNNVK